MTCHLQNLNQGLNRSVQGLNKYVASDERKATEKSVGFHYRGHQLRVNRLIPGDPPVRAKTSEYRPFVKEVLVRIDRNGNSGAGGSDSVLHCLEWACNPRNHSTARVSDPSTVWNILCSLLPQWASGVSLPDIHEFLAHCKVVVALRISAFPFFVARTKFCVF